MNINAIIVFFNNLQFTQLILLVFGLRSLYRDNITVIIEQIDQINERRLFKPERRMLYQSSEDLVQLFTPSCPLPITTTETDPTYGSGNLIKSINDGQSLFHRRDRFCREEIDFSDRQSANPFEVPSLELLTTHLVDVVPGILGPVAQTCSVWTQRTWKKIVFLSDTGSFPIK